jgi:membrane dipeptidase
MTKETPSTEAPADAVIVDGLNVSNWDSDAVFSDLVAGGVTAINATCATWEGFEATCDAIAAWLRRFDQRRNAIRQVRSVADIRAAKRDGRVGIVLGFQNASPIENELSRIALFAALGVRVIQLTYHERNLLGNGCFERRDEGLSTFGGLAVAELNRCGILIDLSHVGDRTTIEAIETSAVPVAVTHANSRSHHDHPRNKTDEALKALASRGGVVGATAITTFLPTGERSSLDDYVDAIDDLVERIGIDHVAFGTDYTQDQPASFWRYIGAHQGTVYPSLFDDGTRDWPSARLYPAGLETPAKLPALWSALDRRGYRAADIRKIVGENWLSLFERVWLHD